MPALANSDAPDASPDVGAHEPLLVLVHPRGWRPRTPADENSRGEGGFDIQEWAKQQNAAAPATPQPGGGPSEPPAPPAQGAKDFDIQEWARQQEDRAREAAPRAENRIKELGRLLSGRDPDVDYATGAPWNVQIALARSDNPEEAAAMLKRRVGEGNYGQDSRGNWWVMQDGKKVAVRPSGGLGASFGNFAVDTMATSPTLAGAISGGAAGGMMGGPPGAMLGAVGGAILGKGSSEVEKGAEGGLHKTVGEEVGTLGQEGLVNGVLEGVGPMAKRTLGPVARKATDWIAHTTDESKAATGRLVTGGARPPMMSVGPGLKSIQYGQRLRNLLLGDPYEDRNTAYAVRRGVEILEDSGVPPQEIEDVMGAILNQDARFSAGPVNEAMTEATQRRFGEMRAEQESATARAREQLDRSEKMLRTYAEGQSSRLGEDVAGAISAARGQFARDMGRAYAAIDQMAGNERVIPITSYRNEARALRMVVPESDLPPLLKQLAESPEDVKLTFAEAHELRTLVRDMASRAHTNLTPGPRIRALMERQGEAEEALESFAEHADNLPMEQAAEGAGLPKEVLEALDRTDAAYREGIAKFKNLRVNQLVKDARDGIFPDPNVVARLILAPGHLEQTRTILAMLPQEMRDQVARADAFNLVTEATNPKTGKIDGGDLRRMLSNPSRAAVMDQVYPPELLARVRQYADELAALDGQLDVRIIKSFSSKDIEQALRTSIQRAEDIDNFAKTNVMRALVSPDPQTVDRAAEALLSGGNEQQLMAARQFFGEQSREWQQVRTYALQKVLHQAIVETPSLSKSVEGKSIDEAMRRWTPAEQAVLFPSGLQEDLRLLAKDMKFLFPQDMRDTGTSLAAAATLKRGPLHPRTWPTYTYRALQGWIAAHPAVLHYLADVRRTPGIKEEAFRRMVGRLGRAVANNLMSGPGRGSPETAQ